MPDSKQHASRSTARPPLTRLGLSEILLRATTSGQVTICAQLADGPGGVKVTGIRLALGDCDRCPTIAQTGDPATIDDADLVCQAVTP